MKPLSTLLSLSALSTLSLLALAACTPMAVPQAPASPPPTLANTRWDLVGYGQAGALTPTVALGTLNFDTDRLGGTTGCNSYGAAFTQDGYALSLPEGGPVSTMMFCFEPAGLANQETAFFGLLREVTGFTLENDQLTLTGPQGVLVFAPAADTPLTDTVWSLAGLAVNDGITSQVGDEAIFITFSGDQANGSAGCNRFFGPFSLADTALSLGALASTRMACEDSVNAREAEFLSALANVAGYSLNRTSLTLLNAEGAVVAQFTAQPAATTTP